MQSPVQRCLEEELILAGQCRALGALLLNIDLDRLEKKVAFGESGMLDEVLAEITRQTDAIEQPGAQGFRLLSATPAQIRESIADCKLFLFFAREFREQHERRGCGCQNQEGQ